MDRTTASYKRLKVQQTGQNFTLRVIICGRKFEILHLLSQPKLDAKITVVPTNSFRLGLHHMDNIVINNGPRKTEDNYQEIGGAARERLELACFHSDVTIGEYVRGHFGIIGYTSKALV